MLSVQNIYLTRSFKERFRQFLYRFSFRYLKYEADTIFQMIQIKNDFVVDGEISYCCCFLCILRVIFNHRRNAAEATYRRFTIYLLLSTSIFALLNAYAHLWAHYKEIFSVDKF